MTTPAEVIAQFALDDGMGLREDIGSKRAARILAALSAPGLNMPTHWRPLPAPPAEDE